MMKKQLLLILIWLLTLAEIATAAAATTRTTEKTTTKLPTTKTTTRAATTTTMTTTTTTMTTTTTTTTASTTTTATTTVQQICSSATWNSNGTTLPIANVTAPEDVGVDSRQNLIVYSGGHLLKYFNNGTTVSLLSGLTGGYLFIDQHDNIYFSDGENNRVLLLSFNGSVTTVAGNGTFNGSGPPQFAFPEGIYVDKNGSVYVADSNNNRVVKWLAGTTQVTVVAGGNGYGNQSNQLSYAMGIFVDEINDGAVYVCDTYANRIQKWLPNATAGTTVAGGNGNGSALNQLYMPTAIIFDPNTKIMFISDYGNNRVLKWLVGASSGTVLAGGNGTGNGTNQLNTPNQCAFDSKGNFYVADYGNNRIQKFAFNTSSCPAQHG
ncbi:unnamed protein product [Didymodactylos carnosus]|uniref:NHL repeat-containing protein n=1 Tax=Didymodactylos carnosus TaxID=1234261 RepID=A0A8S2E162_9BILA|nr:unnamed protein product [Didymodactylos carnosus]CAF3826062.1 unnamed protein product [Didymodactylos carnosus]